MVVPLYLFTIIAANVVTASIDPLQIGAFIVPAGSFLIGFTFFLRDFVQNAIARKGAYLAMAIAVILSALTSYFLGDTLWIVFASAITFIISETADTEIYTRLKLPLSIRVFYSGVVGGFLDSVVFVVIGLSPLGAGFIPWSAVPMAIIGQMIVKILMQLLAAIAISVVVKKQRKFQHLN
ncbi:VUT family protein [Paenibacillus sp. JX-17]|uniref:VUT family protein n=1 Tax=Paenibacillus lacisoli TaxID=3064525 RepID=A0ABT9C9U3_9BACL|nr:VUT family protein [Paenibacillus sp. JX-17]MDO7905348.1 VUT family protein [Paenibacillus sp. JX-17]